MMKENYLTMNKEIDYKKIVEKIELVLNNTKFAVLATSNQEGIVSACQMCLVNDGLTLYFQTDKNFEKITNIKENPNVAINIGSYYFKGKAKIIGHPTSNEVFIDKIKNKHPETYNHYTNLIDEILIEVKLFECKIWGAIDSKNVHSEDIIQIIDFNNKSIQIKTCNKM